MTELVDFYLNKTYYRRLQKSSGVENFLVLIAYLLLLNPLHKKVSPFLKLKKNVQK
jgi:hypothetical protein